MLLITEVYGQGCDHEERPRAQIRGHQGPRFAYIIRYDKETDNSFIGGDGTYLRTSGAIETPDLPILGINTDPSRSTGHLCNQKILNEKKEKQIENIFDQLEKENFEYFYR